MHFCKTALLISGMVTEGIDKNELIKELLSVIGDLYVSKGREGCAISCEAVGGLIDDINSAIIAIRDDKAYDSNVYRAMSNLCQAELSGLYDTDSSAPINDADLAYARLVSRVTHSQLMSSIGYSISNEMSLLEAYEMASDYSDTLCDGPKKKHLDHLISEYKLDLDKWMNAIDPISSLACVASYIRELSI